LGLKGFELAQPDTGLTIRASKMYLHAYRMISVFRVFMVFCNAYTMPQITARFFYGGWPRSIPKRAQQPYLSPRRIILSQAVFSLLFFNFGVL